MSISDEEYNSSSDSEVDEVPKHKPKKPDIKKHDSDSDSESGSDTDTDKSDNELEASDLDDDDSSMDGGEFDEDEIYGGATQKKKTKAAAMPAQNVADDEGEEIGMFDMSDSDDDEDDNDGEQYLQKFDDSVRDTVISNFHPELVQHNYQEIEALSTVVRDERGVIVDPLHRTIPFLTKYERTRILGERAKQINGGAKPFIKVEPDIIDGYLIAQMELKQKKLPFIVRRPINGGYEYWPLSELEIL